MILHALGAPLGEPVADDFDYVARALFEPGLPLFGGYGSVLHWRPLARQVYFKLLTPVMLAHPALVAGLHLALLALAALLLYRALRPRFAGPIAALAASFPLLMESARMLISWPSNFQDVGALLFAALAIHETSRGRLATTLAALLASLLCKELMAAVALLLPWLPVGHDLRRRARWTVAIACLLLAWGVTYLLVHRYAGLTWPQPAAAAATPWLVRLGWAHVNTWHAVFSLPPAGGFNDPLPGVLLVAFVVLAALFLLNAPARGRLRAARPWILWGAAWFVAGWVPLAVTYPDWWAYRGIFAAIGLGLALTALLAAAHPALVGTLFAIRLVLFAVSPGPPPRVSAVPPAGGAFLDFPKLVRLQRLARETRVMLQSRHPALPPHARVGLYHLPRHADYAFGGSRSLQAWYRDSTLRWVSYSEFMAHPDTPLAAIAEFEADRDRQIALVEPQAMRSLQSAIADLERSDWSAALPKLDRADSLQRDPGAVLFAGQVAGMRATALASLGRVEAAEREARRGIVLWPTNTNAHYALGYMAYQSGRLVEAGMEADSVLAADPHNAAAQNLRRAVLKRMQAADSVQRRSP